MEIQKRFLFVDALRGLSALGVVIFHIVDADHTRALIEVHPKSQDMAGWAGRGVNVFFVLSGFVIAHSLYAFKVDRSLFWRFMVRRSIRLDPPYWAAILLATSAAYMSSLLFSDKLFVFSIPSIAAHLFYLQDLLGLPPISAIFWTLCLEVQFYFVYVFILWLGRNSPTKPLQGILAASLLLAALGISLLWPAGVYRPAMLSKTFIPFWTSFLIGVAAYWATRTPRFCGVLLIYSALLGYLSPSAENLVCIATALALWLCAILQKMDRWLRWSVLQFLGSITYSLYIFHPPIIGFVFRLAPKNRDVFGDLLVAFAAVVACIGFAIIMWRAIEVPAMALSKRLPLQGPAPR